MNNSDSSSNNSGKLKYFLTGCGCAILIGALLVTSAFLWFPIASQRMFNNIPHGGITTQLTFISSDANTPVATPSLIQTNVPPAAVGTPIITNDGTNSSGPGAPSSNYLSQLYQAASPGVVSIYVTINNQGQSGQAAGSGFIFDQAGDIVTNNHVVDNASLVVVNFQDGTESMAKIVGTDPYSDLAVVKVDQLPASAHPLPLGDSNSMMTGDWVIAIGNPFGLNSSMSLGIISAIGRTIPSDTASFSIPMVIQTDAAINPGNSGGPLLNLQGQVVGVNAQIASNGTRANAGVGFSIPTDIVRRVIPTLIKVGAFQWSWLGIEGTSMNLFIAKANNLSTDKGAYIVHVVPNGPAEQAGLKGGASLKTVNGLDVPTGGDVITQIDGTQINDYADLQELISQKEPGTDVQLTILRNGQQKQVSVTLAPRPAS